MAASAPSGLTQVFAHRWPTAEWPIARLTVRLEPLAAGHGLTLESWVEDGLGATTGCAIRLTSGVVIWLIERAHAIAQLKARGPDLYADAADTHRHGIAAILVEALATLGLAESDVDWRGQPPTAIELAAFEKHAAELRRTPAGPRTPDP
jgi:hypothetical protein